jgi:hypothetical protein
VIEVRGLTKRYGSTVVITYRVTLDVPLQLVIKVSNLLRKRRKELGTRNGTRALTCHQQAVFILAWFRDRPGLSRLGQGPGISQATRRTSGRHCSAF